MTLVPPVGVLNVRESSPVEGVGMLTVPITPLPGMGGISGGTLKVTKFLLAISVVSKLVGNGGVGVLANSTESKVPLGSVTVLLVALNDWSGKPSSLNV